MFGDRRHHQPRIFKKVFRFHSFEIFDGVLQMTEVVLNIPLQAQCITDVNGYTTLKNLA